MDFEIRRGSVDDIDRIEPLFRALWAHHVSLPNMPRHRTADAAWDYRSGQYRDWFTKDNYTVLLADRFASTRTCPYRSEAGCVKRNVYRSPGVFGKGYRSTSGLIAG